MKLLVKYWPILIIISTVLIFFRPFLLQGKFPIPSDTIVGLYHPFRDQYVDKYPNGIPFKNFLITDPVRQLYPWRYLSVNLMKKGEIPLWNPYTFGGTPLLGNHQSAPFYPLNIILFLLPFSLGWSVLILLQQILASIFMYLYIRNLKLGEFPALIGGLSFAFSGFFIAWLEWGTVVHVGLWLPLILLSIDKVFYSKKYLPWSAIFVFSLIASFFAGHLQTFFYVFIVSIAYFFVRWLQFGRKAYVLFLFIILNSLFIILTAIQWIPMFQFIMESARNLDQGDWQKASWFIPWQNLIQFIAPDFFGNPATLNYWGVWNYAEFVGYIGILPLTFAVLALISRRDKKTLFFGTIFFLALIFSLPTFLAKLPFWLNIPFLSTTQPTRLLFLIDFSLSMLAAMGIDFYLRNRKTIMYPLVLIFLFFTGLWIFVTFGRPLNLVTQENLSVAKNNLIFPTMMFFLSLLILTPLTFFANKKIEKLLVAGIIILLVIDLLRFGEKFTPFTNREYLFPQTKTIEFLQKKQLDGPFRIMSVDNRILPPNFSIIYNLQTIEGYDPLYSQRYAELIAASERGEPNISPPFGFNRIISPHRDESHIIDLLGVRYVFSLSDLSSTKLRKVFQEGQMMVYENINALPRAFFVEEIRWVESKDQALRTMFETNFDPSKMVVVEDLQSGESSSLLKGNVFDASGKVKVIKYSENEVIIEAESTGDSFLVLTDSFYPIWKATIDGSKTKIYLADYNYRGVFIPKGKHVIKFYPTLF